MEQYLFGHPLLTIGALLMIVGVVLVFLRREIVPISLILLAGIAFCLVDNPTITSLVLNIGNLNLNIQKASDLGLDIKTNDIGGINSSIQKINESLRKQDEFNKQIYAFVYKQGANAPLVTNNVEQPNISGVSENFHENNNYSVLVYYKDRRQSDAKALVGGLLAAGFKAASIATDLTEVDIGKRDPDTTFIIPSSLLKDQAGPVEDNVIKVVKDILPPEKTGVLLKRGGPGSIARSQVAIYLY